jgi:hypothetical protein
VQTSCDDTPSPAQSVTKNLRREVREASRMTPAEMRGRAIKCNEQAAQVSDQTAKQIFKDAAREWSDLADQIDHFAKASR